MEQKIREYIKKQLAENTKENYERVLQRFVEWNKGNIRKGNLWVKEYQQHLLGQGMSNKSVNYHLTVVLAFCKEITGKTLYFDRLKEKPAQVKPVEDGDLGRMLGDASDEWQAVIRFMVDTGVRVSELASISERIFHEVPQEILITGKGMRQRVVVLGEGTREAVGRVMRGGLLFGRVITKRAVQWQLSRLAKRNGVSGGVHPHMLRHTMATQMLEAGADITDVQRMLGHQWLATTQIYTHVSDKRIREVWRRSIDKRDEVLRSR